MHTITGRFGRRTSSSLLAALFVLAAIGCGGRASARAVTSAAPPPIAEWERPSRIGDVKPAERLDRPAAGEPGSPGQSPVPDGTAGLRVGLQPGMTLYSLAREHGVALRAIMEANGIVDPTTIPAGTEIFIPLHPNPVDPSPAPTRPGPPPDGRKHTPVVPGRPDATQGRPPALMSIAWPLEGRITGHFGLRGRRHHHDGIDIDGTRGEEIRAVASGTVLRSGSEGQYGRTVVIDHGNGVTTLYAHASRLLVQEGDEVEEGDVIAEVGATGNAHGTHLHFEVRRGGRPVDPVPYLRPATVGATSR